MELKGYPVQSNMYGGNSCRQGLSTNALFSDRNFVFSLQEDIDKLDTSGAWFAGLFRYYPKATVKMYDGGYKSPLGLPTGDYNGKEVDFQIDSSNDVKVSLNGSIEILKPGSRVKFIHNGTRWNISSGIINAGDNCQGEFPAPININNYATEPMAGRFIAFKRKKAPSGVAANFFTP